jgi:Mor family transcriptional regulator
MKPSKATRQSVPQGIESRTQLLQPIIQDLIDAGSQILARHGTAPDAAAGIATEIACEVQRLWGGTSCYIPKTNILAQRARNAEIYKAWRDGDDYEDIAVRYNLTTQRVREIVKTEMFKRRGKGHGGKGNGVANLRLHTAETADRRGRRI